MAVINLTTGAIKTLLSGETHGNTKPVLQVTDIRLLNTQSLYNNCERFRILLSDGSFIHDGILASQMNELVRDGKLQEGSIVMLTQFSVNLIQNRMIIHIIDLGVILEKWDLIGEPKRYRTNTDGNVPCMARATETGTPKRKLQLKDESVETQKLKTLLDSKGKGIRAVSTYREEALTRTFVCKSIKQIYDENIGTPKEPNWITVRATIIFMNAENFCLPVCPNITEYGQCSIFVTNHWYGKWRCNACNELFDECDYSYYLQIKIQDQTGSTWATACLEAGEEIIGIPAKDLYCMKQQNKEKFSELVRNVLFTEFVFMLKIWESYIDGEESVQLRIVKAEKVNLGTETECLLDQSSKLKEEDSISLPPKNEPAVNYVNTRREAGASATQKACLEPKF